MYNKMINNKNNKLEGQLKLLELLLDKAKIMKKSIKT